MELERLQRELSLTREELCAEREQREGLAAQLTQVLALVARLADAQERNRAEESAAAEHKRLMDQLRHERESIRTNHSSGIAARSDIVDTPNPRIGTTLPEPQRL